MLPKRTSKQIKNKFTSISVFGQGNMILQNKINVLKQHIHTLTTSLHVVEHIYIHTYVCTYSDNLFVCC